jgi:Na+-transporting methylmalonyl-CoA/oxaloacetate decarboxylase gamma subunit
LDGVFLLLHLLVFAYWLGGDLGAFYSSRLLVDAERSPEARAAAATILMNVDMAPRMGLIFAFPTGFALAIQRGWMGVDPVWIAPAFVVAALWAVAAWLVHLKTGPHELAGHLDAGVRWLVLTALTVAALLSFAGLYNLPLFVALKLLLLALAIACGLMIRRALKPFAPAFGALVSGQGDTAGDEVIAASLAHAKRYVLVIWLMLFAAAALGVWTPASL